MNIAVIGSRHFQDTDKLENILSNNFLKGDILVSGGAQGADGLAESWACRNGYERLIFKPEWRRYGRSAGYRRNHTIIEHAEKVIAFWDRASRGTAHSIQLAKEKKIPVLIVPF